jgi:hypothetical protein
MLVHPAGVGLAVLVLLLPNAMMRSPAAVAGIDIDVTPAPDTVDPNTLATRMGTGGAMSACWIVMSSQRPISQRYWR